MVSGLVKYAAVVTLAVAAACAHAQVGVTQLGSTVVFYPTGDAEQEITRGPFTLKLAADAKPKAGNHRLVVLSHGSGGVAWTYADLARQLVQAGFIVAAPEHDGDNWHDQSKVGPAAWKQRPAEVSRAIDQVAADARFGPLFEKGKVGMYGMSAGGHTALTLAGGRWSPSQLLKHCEANLDVDFNTCAGPSTLLSGGTLDEAKKAIARPIIRSRLDDAQWYGHTDPRIAAIGAEVPFAVDFDLQTLRSPVAKLGIVQARQDIWLTARFHSARVIEACTTCEVIADLPNASHGSLMSPAPIGVKGALATLLADPPGFDRAEVPRTFAKIVAFFRKNLE